MIEQDTPCTCGHVFADHTTANGCTGCGCWRFREDWRRAADDAADAFMQSGPHPLGEQAA